MEYENNQDVPGMTALGAITIEVVEGTKARVEAHKAA